MKKTISKLLALALTAALVLTGCGGGTGEEANGGENTGSTENGGGESTGDSAAAEGDITDLVIPKLLTRELETFNWLYSQRSEDSENLTPAGRRPAGTDHRGHIGSRPCGGVGQRGSGKDLDLQAARRGQVGRYERQ